MSDKSSVPSPSRMLAVLDLFTEKQLHWTADAISEALACSVPTGYRYVKMLVEAGLLQRSTEAHYTLGPRIMELDHYIRMADPLVRQGVPFMKELVAQSGLDCVISGIYGDQVLDAHREFGQSPASLSYGRGRPRPLFTGAAPKAILSCFPTPRLRRVFDRNTEEIARAGLPAEWEEFRRVFRAIRRAGHYFSNGETDPEVAGVAVPLLHPDGTVVGAISLVTARSRMDLIDRAKLTLLLQRAAEDISRRLAA